MRKWETLLNDVRDEFETRETELETLFELDERLLDESVSLEDTLKFMVESAVQLVRAEFADFLARRHETLEVVSSFPAGSSGGSVGISDSVTGRCVLTSKPVRIGNVRTDPEFSKLFKELYRPVSGHMISELAVPVIFEGAVIGVLNAESPKENHFDIHHERLLLTFAGQASLAFKKTRLFNEVDVFSSVSRLLTSDAYTADAQIQDVLSTALSPLTDFLGRVRHFQILSRDGNHLVVAYSSLGKDINVRVDIDKSVCGEAVLTGRPFLVGDVDSHPKYVRMLGDSIKSEMAVPIWIHGDIGGVLNFESEEADFFDEFSAVVARHFSGQLAWLLALLMLRFEMKSRNKADQANQIIQAMLNQTGNLIHRLNNIVGPIRLQAEEIQAYCQNELAGNKLLADLVAKIRESALDTLKLPEEMRKRFSEIENVNVNSVINEVVSQFRGRSNVIVKIDTTQHTMRVKCQALGDILYTLVQNGVEAMPNGGQISVSSLLVTFANLTDEFAEIIVTDHGTGIPAEHFDKIFEWGFSTKSKERKGLGWGLAWLKTFVEKAGGSVSFVSAVDKGTTFTLRFPLSK